MKVLITGVSGRLGHDAAKLLKAKEITFLGVNSAGKRLIVVLSPGKAHFDCENIPAKYKAVAPEGNISLQNIWGGLDPDRLYYEYRATAEPLAGRDKLRPILNGTSLQYAQAVVFPQTFGKTLP